MKLLITFIVLNVLNVIIQTVKSIATIKCGKSVAAIVNAVAYGLYTVVIVYTVCDLPLWAKVLVVAVANLIGVFVVKLLEEKSRKDKLWKIEVSIKEIENTKFRAELFANKLPHSSFALADSDYFKYDIYAATQKESAEVREILKKYETAKYFVTESKAL